MAAGLGVVAASVAATSPIQERDSTRATILVPSVQSGPVSLFAIFCSLRIIPFSPAMLLGLRDAQFKERKTYNKYIFLSYPSFATAPTLLQQCK